MRSIAITGAHIVVYINGKAFGRATGFSWKSDTSRRAVYALDSIDPYDIQPTTTKITGRVDCIRTINDGGLEGAGIVGTFHDIPREKWVSLMLVERSTGTVIFKSDNVQVAHQSWNIGLKAVVSGSFEFEAIDWSNEAAAH